MYASYELSVIRTSYGRVECTWAHAL
jgi:hypothetical protein